MAREESVSPGSNAFVDADELRARLARVIPQRRPVPPPEPESRESLRRVDPGRVEQDRLKASVTGLEDEVLEQAAALEALQKRVDTLESLREAAEKTLSDSAALDAHVETLGKSLEAARRRIERLTKDFSSLSKRVAAIPEALEPGVSRDQLSEEVGTLAKALRREFEALAKEVEAAAKSRKSADDAERQKWMKDVGGRLARVEKALADAAKRSPRASPEASALKAVERRLAALEPALAVAKELPALGRRVKQLEEESDEVRGQVGDVLTQIRRQKEALGPEHQERVGSLERQLADLVGRLEEGAEGRAQREQEFAEGLLRVEGRVTGLAARVEKDLLDQLASLRGRVDDIASSDAGSAKLGELEQRINETLGNIVSRIARAEEQAARMDEARTAAAGELRRLSTGLALLKRGTAGIREDLAREGFRYFAFEDLHRGPSDVVKERQRELAQFFIQCRDVLDIGCGRGEFLELAAEHGIGARGVDVDEDMILHCQRKGLKAERAEAASYLSSLPAKSLDGIMAAHVLEHMDPVEVLRLLKLAYERLKFGTSLVVETVNPLCLNALGTSFYLDPTHARPIHPEMLRFMLQAVGFRDAAIHFELPFDTEQLPDVGADGDHLAPVLAAVRQLQQVVLGPRDYFARALK